MICPPDRRVRYALLAASSAAAFLLATPMAPASAAPVADLNCTITVDTDVHPGLTPQLRHINSISGGLTGTATCTGTVDGQPVTGPGSFLDNTHLIGNCTQATGHGNFVLKIPTADGTKTVAGRFDFTFPAAPPLTGDLTGTPTVIAADGDCFTTPITHTTTVLTVHVT